MKDLRNLDPELREFSTRRLRRFIEPKPGRRVEACWAIRTREDDIDTILSAALAQEKVLAED